MPLSMKRLASARWSCPSTTVTRDSGMSKCFSISGIVQRPTEP
jgi:hypothetical protein